ncbi:copper amine oxidase N-terminal domain-containing protein [Paenibacillus sp. FSL H7-0331]|uniref:copper amine oxidase N-terminal domain-containing protein n=1 Tax=Paenibacillus sp. FSL H7-0331 TaxID=1920421 RepID=UPI0009FB560F
MKLFINGKSVSTDIQIINGQSYVPLRVVSESLGADVRWDENSKTIAIASPQASYSKPPTTPGSDLTKSDEWQTYSNVRFDFSVSTPKKWTRGEESFNGDGTQLYIGKPDVEMSASASHYMPDIFNPYTD